MCVLELCELRGRIGHVRAIVVAPAMLPQHGVIAQEAVARCDLAAHFQQLRRVGEGQDGEPAVEIDASGQGFALA